jgi:death-on-curing protein
MTEYLDLYDAVQQIERFGFRVKDYGLLESALARPQTRLFGEDAYPTFELKCAALMQSLIKNHSLFDGNKRTTWMLLNSFVLLNDFDLVMTADEGFDFTLGMATDKYGLEHAARIIRNHLVQR